MVYGFLGGGTLIKYIPYPVVTGYLSGVGVVIFFKQLPALFGFPKELSNGQGLTSPTAWRLPGLVVGLVTTGVMLVAEQHPRLGWRLFWRWQSRPERPPIPVDPQRLIVTGGRVTPKPRAHHSCGAQGGRCPVFPGLFDHPRQPENT